MQEGDSNRGTPPRFFTDSELESVSRYLVGNSVRPHPNILVPQSAGPARVQVSH